MQLLTRNEILSKKNSEEKFASDQGIELANRIDGLRKLSLQEEKNLSVSRNQNLGVLISALDSLNEECRLTRIETEKAKNEREELIKPLDSEWSRLRAEQSSWLERVTEIENDKNRILILEKELQEKIDISDENIEISNEIKEGTRKLKTQQELKNKEIERLSNQFYDAVAKFNAERNTHLEAHAERERILSNREAQLENKVKNFNQREREFNLNVRKHRQ